MVMKKCTVWAGIYLLVFACELRLEGAAATAAQQASQVGAKFDENALKNIAEVEGLGYKNANLKVLDELAKSFNTANKAQKLSLVVAVPEFLGIP